MSERPRERLDVTGTTRPCGRTTSAGAPRAFRADDQHNARDEQDDPADRESRPHCDAGFGAAIRRARVATATSDGTKRLAQHAGVSRHRPDEDRSRARDGKHDASGVLASVGVSAGGRRPHGGWEWSRGRAGRGGRLRLGSIRGAGVRSNEDLRVERDENQQRDTEPPHGDAASIGCTTRTAQKNSRRPRRPDGRHVVARSRLLQRKDIGMAATARDHVASGRTRRAMLLV
jgi:hypothetical protein